MLWVVLDKLQVGMSNSSSKNNFYNDIKGIKIEFKKHGWKIKCEQSTMGELTSNMKLPHYRT
jgi:hypothetical protein